MTPRTWWVYDRTSWEKPGLFVRAETRGKAKVIGADDMMLDFIDVGCHRAPEHDDTDDRGLERINWDPEDWWEAI